MKLEQVLSILKRKTGVDWYGNNSNRGTALNFDFSNRAKPIISVDESKVKVSSVVDLASKFNKRGKRKFLRDVTLIEVLESVEFEEYDEDRDNDDEWYTVKSGKVLKGKEYEDNLIIAADTSFGTPYDITLRYRGKAINIAAYNCEGNTDDAELEELSFVIKEDIK